MMRVMYRHIGTGVLDGSILYDGGETRNVQYIVS